MSHAPNLYVVCKSKFTGTTWKPVTPGAFLSTKFGVHQMRVKTITVFQALWTRDPSEGKPSQCSRAYNLVGETRRLSDWVYRVITCQVLLQTPLERTKLNLSGLPTQSWGRQGKGRQVNKMSQGGDDEGGCGGDRLRHSQKPGVLDTVPPLRCDV